MLNKIKIGSPSGAKPGGRPPAAIEITRAGVLAAALPGNGEAPVYAFAALPAGALVPSLEEPNLRAPEAVAASIRAVLDEVSPRSRAVSLVVPDMLVRVFVLDFDSFPVRAAEAVPVLRFRLRKMVPFDVEHAGVSYQVLTQEKNEWRVLTAVVPGPILAEYESAVHAAGYEPGAVLSSSLAALETADPMESVLAANLGESSLTTLIANGQDLLLYRTLDLPEDLVERAAEIQRGVAVAAAYFEDKLGAPPRTLYCAGSYDAGELALLLDDGGLAMAELAPRPAGEAKTALGRESIAGVTGALTGAR